MKILITSEFENRPVKLTIAEIGVLLTGINRSINSIIQSDYDNELKLLGDFKTSAGREPTGVVLSLLEARHGSLEIQLAIDFLNSVGLDPDTAKNILINILANAIWDVERSKRLVYDFRRAIQRISNGANGKVIVLKIYFKNKIKTLKANINLKGKVKIITDDNTKNK